MAESLLTGDFSFAAMPGGNWPAIIGAPKEETGGSSNAENTGQDAVLYVKQYVYEVD